MLQAEMEKLVRDLYGARLGNDLKNAAGYFSADSRFAINGAMEASNIALNISGKAKIEELLTDLFRTWQWTEQDIKHILIQDNRAAVHYRLKARFMPTGAIVDTEICDLLTFQDGQLTEIIQFLDTALVGRLMGQAPGAGQPAAA